jgi:hypothetical protein
MVCIIRAMVKTRVSKLPILEDGPQNTLHHRIYIPITFDFPWNGIDYHNPLIPCNLTMAHIYILYICSFMYYIYISIHSFVFKTTSGTFKKLLIKMGMILENPDSIYFRMSTYSTYAEIWVSSIYMEYSNSNGFSSLSHWIGFRNH